MNSYAKENKLNFYLLGPPRVEYQGKTLDIPRRQVRTLVYLLACQSQPVPYQTLHYIFWSSQPEGFCRRNLSHLFTHLRNVLPVEEILIRSSVSASLDSNLIWSDVIEFIRLASQPQKEENLSDFTLAHHLYRGVFLEGKYLPKSPELEKYIEQRRLNLELVYLKNLFNLIILHKNQRDYSSAIDYAEIYLSIDNFNEEILNEQMILHGLMGNNVKIIQSYENFSQKLKEELNIEPSKKNREFIQQFKESNTKKPANHSQTEGMESEQSDLITVVNHDNWLTFQEMINRKNGSGGIALVIGEIGMGKAALISQYMRQSDPEQLNIRINCTPATLKIRLFPFRELAKKTISIIESRTYTSNLFSPKLNEIATALSKPIHIQSTITDQMVELIMERDFSLVQALFRELSTLPNKFVISFENIEWIDEDSLELILFLSKNLDAQNITFICSFCCRKEEKLKVFERNVEISDFSLGILHLDDLSYEDGVKMVQNAFGKFPEVGRITKQLLNLTGGNYFYLSEILEWMKVNKKTAEQLAKIKKIEIPPIVKQKIIARFERFSKNEKNLLQFAAVKGSHVSFEEIRGYVSLNNQQTLDLINDLICRNFIGFESDLYFIKYEIIRQSILSNMNSSQKRAIENFFTQPIEE